MLSSSVDFQQCGMSKISSNVLSKLCSVVLSKLCGDVLSKFCSNVLSKLCRDVLSKLCSNVLSKLCGDVLSKLCTVELRWLELVGTVGASSTHPYVRAIPSLTIFKLVHVYFVITDTTFFIDQSFKAHVTHVTDQ